MAAGASTRARTPALLIVDVINHFDFEGGRALGARARPLAPRIHALRARYDRAGKPVVYVNDNWTDWRGGFDDLVAACIDAGGDAAALATRLQPGDTHFHVLKPRQSGFMHSALPALLDQQGVDALTIVGVATDACVLATALDAHMRQYPLWIPSDCTAAISSVRKAHALALLRQNSHAVTLASARVGGVFPSGAG